MIFPWNIFIPQTISYVPSFLGITSILTVLFMGRNFLILKSGSTTSSRHVLGSFLRKLSVVVLLTGTEILLGEYPPFTKTSMEPAATTVFSFFIRKNQ